MIKPKEEKRLRITLSWGFWIVVVSLLGIAGDVSLLGTAGDGSFSLREKVARRAG
jgi:hypothetical protein